MPVTLGINYDNAANFTFDSQKIEVLTSAKLKRLIPQDAILTAAWDSTVNASYAAGSKTASLQGTPSPSISTYGLDLRGSVFKAVDYATSNNWDYQKGAVRFKLKPNYSGTPANAQVFFAAYNDPGSQAINNQFSINHNADGNLYIYHCNGGTVLSTSLGAWSPSAGTEYEFEINYDFQAGNLWVFRDGVLLSSITGIVRDYSNHNTIRIGSNIYQQKPDFEIADLIIFNQVQHTSNYSPGYIVADTDLTYDITNPIIDWNSTFTSDEIVSFSENSIKSGADEIKYQILIDGNPKYFNGTEWKNSDGSYTQSNTADEIQSNLSTLDISTGASISIRSLLHSADGTTTPELISLSIEYNYFGKQPNLLQTCTIWGYVFDSNNNPIENVEISAKPTQSEKAILNYQIYPGTVKTKSKYNGYWELDLIRSDQFNPAITYDFTFTYPSGKIDKKTALTIPASSFEEFNNL